MFGWFTNQHVKRAPVVIIEALLDALSTTGNLNLVAMQLAHDKNIAKRMDFTLAIIAEAAAIQLGRLVRPSRVLIELYDQCNKAQVEMILKRALAKARFATR